MRLQQLRGPASLTGPQRGQTGRDTARVTSREGRRAPGSWAEHPVSEDGGAIDYVDPSQPERRRGCEFLMSELGMKEAGSTRETQTHTSCSGIRCIFVWKKKKKNLRAPSTASRGGPEDDQSGQSLPWTLESWTETRGGEEPQLAPASWWGILSHVQFFATPWTAACPGSSVHGFSRQEYWTRLPYPPPGDLPNPGIRPSSLALQVDSSPTKPLNLGGTG